MLHLLTHDNGRAAYVVYGRGKGRSVLFTPLTIIDIEPQRQAGRDVPTLRDYTVSYVATRLHTDIRRTTCALFIAEILYRTLAEPEADEPLFNFVRQAVIDLDTTPEPSNIHVSFLTDYIGYLGFAPDREEPDNKDLFRLLDLTGPCSRTNRHAQLDALMDYYHRHLPDFVTPKSLDVLKQIFD